MSKRDELVKKVAKHPKMKKIQEENLDSLQKEPKKKATRTKKQPPSKEEVMKMLLDSSNELSQIIQELKDEEKLLTGQPLKRVFELIAETLKNLDEDKNEIDEEYKQLSELKENIALSN